MVPEMGPKVMLKPEPGTLKMSPKWHLRPPKCPRNSTWDAELVQFPQSPTWVPGMSPGTPEWPLCGGVTRADSGPLPTHPGFGTFGTHPLPHGAQCRDPPEGLGTPPGNWGSPRVGDPPRSPEHWRWGRPLWGCGAAGSESPPKGSGSPRWVPARLPPPALQRLTRGGPARGTSWSPPGWALPGDWDPPRGASVPHHLRDPPEPSRTPPQDPQH